MGNLTFPPLYAEFVNEKGYVSPRWNAYFEALEAKFDLYQGQLAYSADNIISDSGSVNLSGTNGLLIAGGVWTIPVAAGQVLTYDGTNYSWTTATFDSTPTGAVRFFAGTTAPDGWIFLDDGSIGNASSGATTRANADTEDLYTVLWNNISDTYCPVSSGRGASAAADFAAGKTLALFKFAGRGIKIKGSGTSLGQTEGAETAVMTEAQMPQHKHSVTGEDVIGIGIGTNRWMADYPSKPLVGSPDSDARYFVTASTDEPATTTAGSSSSQNIVGPSIFEKGIIKL